MKLLIIGMGGVGQSAAMIIKRAGEQAQWAEKIVLADHHLDRAQATAARTEDPRFIPEELDAGDAEGIARLVKKYDIDWIVNAVTPAYNEIIFDTALELGVNYMDCAMTLGKAHPEKPFELANIKLGDYQFAKEKLWEEKGLMALVGSGMEPGISDVLAKYAAKHLFDEIDEVSLRDGDNYHIPGHEGPFFGFSIWTTIEECLNPPLIWEKDKGWFCTEYFSEPETFYFPEVGEVELVNVEHEEVVLVPREIDCKRVTFKYGVPREMREMLLYLKDLGMADAKKKIKIGDQEITPRDFLTKVVPNPRDTASRMEGKECGGAFVTGKKDGMERAVFLYQVSDNQECVKRYGTNSVVAQTAVSMVVMLELAAKGLWYKTGVHGPEAFEPEPFMDLMYRYEFPLGMEEKPSEYAAKMQREGLQKRLGQEL
ncbi:MAG: saccharopine dehydrogenase NADP-binding domain-containing protein [Firmicutes bacterium]|nr:saccharopine dehydrogenase NADP-binding domain-containing protein [Bacillota bacterium]